MKINLKQLLFATAIAAVVCFCLRRPALWLFSGLAEAKAAIMPWQHWAYVFGYEPEYYFAIERSQTEFGFFFASMIVSLVAHCFGLTFAGIGIYTLWKKLGTTT